MEKFPDDFKRNKNEEVQKIEKEALNKSGSYLKFANTIEGLNLEIESIEEEIAQKYVEIDNIQELISNNYLNNTTDNASSVDIENNHLLSLKRELEDECLMLKIERKKLEDKRFILIKSN